MRYTLIELRKREGHWDLAILPDEKDREPEDWEPHFLGFFHAPRRQTARVSFNKLRDALVDRRRKMIKVLQQEIEDLESFELPPGTPARPSESIFHQFKRKD